MPFKRRVKTRKLELKEPSRSKYISIKKDDLLYLFKSIDMLLDLFEEVKAFPARRFKKIRAIRKEWDGVLYYPKNFEKVMTGEK